MPRYIDADALYKDTERRIKEANSYRMAVVDDEFLDLIKDAETADVSEIRAEAYEEFAKRLKESAFDCDVSFGYGREHYTKAVSVIEIDNLVKEMVGEH